MKTLTDGSYIAIKPPRTLECIIIKNYPTKYAKAFKALKEFLDKSPHITKYCNIIYDKPVKAKGLGKWNLINVKPENIYVFPHYLGYSRFIALLGYIRFKHEIVRQYTLFPTFYLKSDDYSLEYYSSFGNLLIDKCNLEHIKDNLI